MMPFNERTECPKCGCVNTLVRFIAAQEVGFGTHSKECLAYRCPRCDYTWKTKTKSEREVNHEG